LVTIGTSKQSVLAPYSPNLEYAVASSKLGVLPTESRDFRVETLAVLASLRAGFRLPLLIKKRLQTSVGERLEGRRQQEV
jgi:hypothetical protein